MLRIEAYATMDALTLHVAGSNLREPSTLAGGNGMSVYRTIGVETVEEMGVDDALFEALVQLFKLYPGLAEYALR